MIKRHLIKIYFFLILLSFSSCATIFSGKLDPCQREKPEPGQPDRKLRPLFLIVNIPVIGHVVDFSTGAIYKPCILPAGTIDPKIDPATGSPND